MTPKLYMPWHNVFIVSAFIIKVAERPSSCTIIVMIIDHYQRAVVMSRPEAETVVKACDRAIHGVQL